MLNVRTNFCRDKSIMPHMVHISEHRVFALARSNINLCNTHNCKGCNYFYLTEYLWYSDFLGFLAVQRQLWNMLSTPFRNKRTNSSSQHFPFEISVWASTTMTKVTHLTVYVSAPANTTLVGILTLSFLLETHIPCGRKALTFKGDAFHQWTLKIQEVFYFKKATKQYLYQKKRSILIFH